MLFSNSRNSIPGHISRHQTFDIVASFAEKINKVHPFKDFHKNHPDQPGPPGVGPRRGFLSHSGEVLSHLGFLFCEFHVLF